jgi:hypothetical protein
MMLLSSIASLSSLAKIEFRTRGWLSRRMLTKLFIAVSSLCIDWVFHGLAIVLDWNLALAGARFVVVVHNVALRDVVRHDV